MTAPDGLNTQGTRHGPRLGPALILGLCLLYLLHVLTPPKADGPYDLVGFGQLPVVDQGRVKPLDTLARISLMIVSDSSRCAPRGARSRQCGGCWTPWRGRKTSAPQPSSGSITPTC